MRLGQRYRHRVLGRIGRGQSGPGGRDSVFGRYGRTAARAMPGRVDRCLIVRVPENSPWPGRDAGEHLGGRQRLEPLGEHRTGNPQVRREVTEPPDAVESVPRDQQSPAFADYLEGAIVEPALFRSREFSAAAVALFLFFIAFAAWLLITVLFLQDLWHYSALRAGLAIVPGPLTSAVFAVNSGRISRHVSRVVPAIAGSLLIAAAAGYWFAVTPAHPAYVTGFLPGLLIAGAGAGLTQAPLFAAASTLPPDRATTGAAVLNMSRQLGSAVGIAVLVALLVSPHPGSLGLFHRGWLLVIAAAVSAAVTLLATAKKRKPTA